MAALSITASAVLRSSLGSSTTGVAGAAITAGQALYIDTANSNVMKLTLPGSASPANVFAGFALNNAAIGQPVDYCGIDAVFTFGATVNAGDDIWLHPTAGAITKTRADVTTGTTVVHLGCALGLTGSTTVTTMNLKPCTGGVV